jgi:hypothetical protein
LALKASVKRAEILLSAIRFTVVHRGSRFRRIGVLVLGVVMSLPRVWTG